MTIFLTIPFQVKLLGFLGGKDIPEAVRRVLHSLMSNEVAKNLNWQGGLSKSSIREFPKILQFVAGKFIFKRVYFFKKIKNHFLFCRKLILSLH